VALVVGQGGGGTAGDLLANAIVPDTPTGRSLRTIDVRRLSPEELAAADLAGVDTIWLAGAAPLEEALWPKLAVFVQAGGSVILIPGEGSRPSDLATPAAEQFLGTTKIRDVSLAEPAAVQMAPSDYRHGVLADFAGGRNGDLGNLRVRRLWAMDVSGAGRVTLGRLPLGAGGTTPLIVAGTLGKGRVLVWATGPQRQWSTLAAAAEFPVLVHSTIKYLTDQYQAQGQFLFGEPVQFPLPRDWPLLGSTARLYLPDGTDRTADIDRRGRTILGTADQVGPHVIALGSGQRDVPPMLIGYAVNIDPAESDLAPLDRERLVGRQDGEEGIFRPEAFRVVADAEALRRGEAMRIGNLDISPLLALAMLVLLCGECFFANRFYRRPPAAAETLETSRTLRRDQGQ
jgi:hypothetical protein